MTEPAKTDLSIPRAAVPAFFRSLQAKTKPVEAPRPFFGDDSVRISRTGNSFTLKLNCVGTERHFSLYAHFVDAGERQRLEYKREDGFPPLLILIGGGLIIFCVLMLGLFSKTSDPGGFLFLWCAVAGAIAYGNYHALKQAGITAEARMLKPILESLLEAERSTQAPAQSSEVPTEPTH